MGLPFLPFAGPALFTPSYELVSRMAAAAPAARAAPRLSFVGRLSLLRCCLAPGDSARLLRSRAYLSQEGSLRRVR